MPSTVAFEVRFDRALCLAHGLPVPRAVTGQYRATAVVVVDHPVCCHAGAQCGHDTVSLEPDAAR